MSVVSIPASVNLIPEAPVRHMVELAMEAERLGFERCWIYDEGLATRDVYVTMAAVATRTRTIKIGTGITNPYTRHPASTAGAIATIHELSGGRAFLGLGAGGSLTLGPLGTDRSHPLRAVRETLAACRALFTGEPVNYVGETVSLTNATLGFADPSIEIWLAGRGPKMLQLGGALADGVMLDFLHKDTMGDYVDLVRNGAATTGNDPDICYSTMIVTSQAELDAVRPHMTYRLVDSPAHVKEKLGITPADVEAIKAAMPAGLHEAAQFVKEEWVHPFVIAGTASECGAELAQMMDQYGIDEFLLPVLELHQAVETMQTLAEVLTHT
jgi:5,10-methylenetetrahydromethanopterin reductase